MTTLDLVGWLRRFRLWPRVRLIVRAISSPLARVAHSLFVRLGPRFSGQNLRLKHRFDHAPLYIDPQSINRQIRVGRWRDLYGPSRLDRLRAWYTAGDGLKNTRIHLTRNLHGKFIADGDWDVRSKEIEVLPVITQLFVEGKTPRETDAYQRQLKRIQNGELTWTKGLSSQAELDQYYDDLITAHEDIKNNGYRTQRELGENGIDEIRVCVDRMGRICSYGGGTHRISMARILSLDAVPVILKRIHALWLSQVVDTTSGLDDAAVDRALIALGFRFDARPGLPMTRDQAR